MVCLCGSEAVSGTGTLLIPESWAARVSGKEWQRCRPGSLVECTSVGKGGGSEVLTEGLNAERLVCKKELICLQVSNLSGLIISISGVRHLSLNCRQKCDVRSSVLSLVTRKQCVGLWLRTVLGLWSY